MIGRIGFFILYFVAFLPLTVIAGELPSISITKNTNPKIVELYQQLQDTKDKINKIQSERTEKLSENYQALKENEQSLANRTLTAATTAATGIGGMELLSGLAEQRADKNAEIDMDAYLATFRCEYADGKTVPGGTNRVELPGDKLFDLYQEYVTLAADLKERKEALGLKPGIESEVILDKANIGLYDDTSTGITNGTFASLYRAKTGNEIDKTKLAEEQTKSENRVKGGAIAAGAGVVGGVVGNAIINKDAPKNESKKINAEYDKQVAEATAEQDKLEKELNTAIAKNAEEVKEYNKKLQQHKEQIDEIKQSSPECQTLFTEYVDNISSLSPVESETDSVPDTNFPDVADQKNLLTRCTTEYSQCNIKGGVFDAANNKCSCPEAKPIEKDGKCVEQPIEPVPNTNTVNEQITGAEPVEKRPEVTINENLSEEEQTDKEETTENTTNTETGVEYCPATGNKLKSITDKTKVGDSCSSTNISLGEVVWAKTSKPKTVCTCVAQVCNDGYEFKGGSCVTVVADGQGYCLREEYPMTDENRYVAQAVEFCGKKAAEKKCKYKAVNVLKSTNKVICNPDQTEVDAVKAQMDANQKNIDANLKYYNCGEGTNLPNGITCKFVQDFKREKVTPMEATGLMTEYALKKYKDDIKCDDKSHRKSNDYRQCVSRKNSKVFYEFEFKNLDGGNGGFTDALCLIWGLKGGENLCKSATKTQCDEISAAINRTFYIGGSAELKGANCVINSHPKAESAPIALFNTKVLTKEDLRAVNSIDSLHFYDKKLQVNANSDVYKSITNYLFVEQRLPIKQFTCGAGIVDNVPYYNISRTEYDAAMKKIRDCQALANPTSESYGADIAHCQKNAPPSMNGDLLTCEYDGKPVDFLFKKLDVKWNRKSTAGYQGLRCLTEGGDFTGKSCTLASKSQCDSFNECFKKDYPNSKGMEWDDDIGACVLKDAKYVSNVQKVAEVTGMVALTLVTSVTGGPVVWALAAVEGAALVTEAVTEGKISDWAEAFLADAARCKEEQSSCANTVMKKHIARIMEGSNQFSETQNKQIAKQTERLLGMLDETTLSAIVDKGEGSGYISEERAPDLEKSIRAYYGTQLTSQEKALLVTKKVATVATFATLIGSGIMSGLRQAFKHNWIHLSPEKQAKWLKLRILRPGDVTNVTTDAAKAVTHEMTPAQAKRLNELDSRIAVLEGKTNRTHAEAEELKKLHQERNTLLNKVGTKDADELAKLSGAAFDKKAVEEAQAEYKTARERYDYVRKYMSEHNGNPPSGTTKYDIQDINNNMAKAEKKLKDLGQDVTPVEQLQIGKKPSAVATDAKPVEPKPAESTPKPTEDSSAKPADDVGRSTGNPIKSKAEKIAEAKQRGDLGYHGTDADIAMDDMIRPSANTSEQLGNVGYGIAQNYDDAEAYAVRRLIERQNPGASIKFSRENGMLIITSDKPLQLTNKTGYVYTTAKESSVSWDTMYNGLGGWKAAKMPNSVEILEKKALNLDDMVRQGKVKIIEPKPANVSSAATGTRSATRQAANTAANKADDVAKNKYSIRKTIKPFGNYTGGQKEANGVFEIVDNQTGQVMYLKRTSANEVSMTKRAASINFGSNSVVHVVQPADLTPAQIDDMVKNLGITVPDYVKADTWLLTKAVPDGEDLMTIVKNGGKLHNGTAITNAEIDQIISDMKKLKTSGVNHTDLYTNTIIRRSANGKLEAYIIDFESAGIHDVTFIEKELNTIRSVEPNVAKASTRISASEAQAANVATLRKQASQNFDTYLAEAKNNANGKSTHLIPKSRLNEAGWNEINKSLATEDVQLVEITQDGKQYMQFVRANHTDDVVSGTRNVSKSIKLDNNVKTPVELNENELVRVVGNGGNPINNDYIQASKDARKYMNDSIASGRYVRNEDAYIDTMNEMHRISATGENGNLNWYADAGQGSMEVNPGQIRGKGRPRNSRITQAQTVEKVAIEYGDPFRVSKTSVVQLPGIPENNLPINENVAGRFFHHYPDGGEALRPYYIQMHRTAQETLNLIEKQAPEKQILEKLAEHYQYAANARPYGQINNSLFMNEVNTLLQKAGLQTMPHGELDIAAMHLQPSTFKKYFVDTYYRTRL